MWETVLVLGWVVAASSVAIGWRRLTLRERAWQRLAQSDTEPEVIAAPQRSTRRMSRRWIWVPWAFAIVAALAVWFVTGWAVQYIAAIGLLVGLIGGQAEAFLAGQMAARLEAQLADAIDIMVGALGAGAGVNNAIEAAIVEAQPPLRPYLEEVSGLIRLGEDAGTVFRALSQRVPLETFLLFSSALAVHWEVGGSLAPTLATVGRSIRDRIETARRIRSNTAQSQLSTLSIIGLTYFIAVVVWRNGPDQMREFVTSSVGSWFVAGSIVLQAVGIVWMNVISRPRF